MCNFAFKEKEKKGGGDRERSTDLSISWKDTLLCN